MTEFDFAKINRELAARAAARNARLRPVKSFDRFFITDYLTEKRKELSESMTELAKTTGRYLNQAASFKDVDYYFDLDDKGPKLLVKKLIRKANKFLFLRNIDKQRHFNSSLIESNMVLSERIDTLQKQLDALQRQYELNIRLFEKITSQLQEKNINE